MTSAASNTTLLKLSNATLASLPSSIARPSYNRKALRPGIVHIGVGNFHRAHQSWYLHRLMQDGHAHNWAIIGAGVRAYDTVMREKLRAQDCLTSLLELDPGRSSAEVVGSMIDYLPVEENNATLIATMADPTIRIVSLTVTEGGYYVDPVTGEFDPEHEDIRHDVANPQTPTTAFGAMVEALRLRRAAGHGPFTGQSCDNLQGNGEILRQTLVSLARLTDPDLAAWIEANGAFPNSMVDCIVPVTGPEEIERAHDFGLDDPVTVAHENFRQWVIEDKFCAGRPDWDLAGATFSHDVHAFEKMKLRVLNGGHQILANAGEILGIETISNCMTHAGITGLFNKVQVEEIAPYVDPVPGYTPEKYTTLIVSRFANPKIHDTTRRVAFDGSSRHPGFILPTIRDAVAAGGSVTGLALVQALWARMAAGTRDDGSVIEANDPFWDDITAVAQAAKTRPMAWLEQENTYGDLAEASAFAEPFTMWLDRLWAEGTDAVLKSYAAG